MQVDIELSTHPGIVREEIVLIGTGQLSLVCIGIIIVPRIIKADTAYQIHIHGIIILAPEEGNQIEHQVKVGGSILVVILEVLLSPTETALVPKAAHMQT